MAVTIDELQVETQPPQAPRGVAAEDPAKPKEQPNLEAEMERLRERALRLQAD